MAVGKNPNQAVYEITDYTGLTKTYSVEYYSDKIDTSKTNSTTGNNSKFIFDNLWWGQMNNTYGSYLLTPKNTFYGFCDTWGAGTGVHSSGGDSSGAGGYTSGIVKFEANKNYSIVVGERGLRDNINSQAGGAAFGGGGRGHGGGSTGGGLSGIFVGNKDSWGRTWVTPGLAQANALLIAGGGGGGGHGGNSHHGTGGGGGGNHGTHGHNAGGGSQTGGGSGGYSGGQSGYALHGGHSGNSSVCGGGGGGWFGGGGGGHTSNHHNGGGGGSGHIAHDNSATSNYNLRHLVLGGFTEGAPGYHAARNNGSHSGAYSHPLRRGAGQGTNDNNWYVTEGRVVIQLAPSNIGQSASSY